MDKDILTYLESKLPSLVKEGIKGWFDQIQLPPRPSATPPKIGGELKNSGQAGMTNVAFLKKTVIIGLGNPILTDDGVGIKVSRILKDRLSHCNEIDVKEVYAGGIRLMDEMIGYEKAVIVDAIVTGNAVPGTIRQMSLLDALMTKNIISSHDTNLLTAIEMGRMLGLRLPSVIKLWGIEAKDTETFGEDLTEKVAYAVQPLVEKILEDCGDVIPACRESFRRIADKPQ
jgi:hydrogenase maturation protease